jgi:hypothetical protein
MLIAIIEQCGGVKFTAELILFWDKNDVIDRILIIFVFFLSYQVTAIVVVQYQGRRRAPCWSTVDVSN